MLQIVLRADEGPEDVEEVVRGLTGLRVMLLRFARGAKKLVISCAIFEDSFVLNRVVCFVLFGFLFLLRDLKWHSISHGCIGIITNFHMEDGRSEFNENKSRAHGNKESPDINLSEKNLNKPLKRANYNFVAAAKL